MTTTAESTTKGTSKPLYQSIADALRDEILTQHAHNDQLPTQRELALRFKTSYMTVNNALQQLVQEGLIRRTTGVGTFVQDLRTVSRGLIGIMTSCHDPVYLARLFGTIERELRQARYRPIVFGGSSIYQEELNALNEMGRFNEAGLIIYSRFITRLAEEAETFRQGALPVVTINRPIRDFDCSRVDHRMIGVLQARHILAQKCRQLLIIETSGQIDPLPAWIEGLMSTLVQEGDNPPLIRTVSAQYAEGQTETQLDVSAKQQVQDFTRKAFAEPSVPDAIVVHGDRYLPAVVEVLTGLNLKPGRDVQLISSDNQNLRGFPYTTVDEGLDEIGHQAARLLLDRLEGRVTGGPPRIHMVTPKLVQYT